MADKIVNFADYKDGYKVPVIAHENSNNTYSLGVLNNPQGIPDSTNAFVMTNTPIAVQLNTLTPLISIRNDSVDKNFRLGTLSIATDGSKPVIFTIYKNGTLTGASFVAYGGDSFCSYDISATAITNQGMAVGGLVMNKLDTQRINLFTNDVFIKAGPNDVLTLCAKSTSNTEITLFIRHLEMN